MNPKASIEDDDLAMYAMGLLAPPESSTIADAVAASSDLRQRLAMVQEVLALYGEASVELMPAPAGSLDRLKSQLSHPEAARPPLAPVEPIRQPGKPRSADVLAMASGSAAASAAAVSEVAPAAARAPGRPSRAAQALAWTGWTIAAALLVVAGRLYHDRAALHAALNAQTAQAAQISSAARELSRQRDTLAADVVDQAHQIQQLSSRTAVARTDAEILRSALASENNQIASKDDQLASKDNLIAAQSSQVAQLSSDAARTREILTALTGETALHLALTKPKSHGVPLAEAAYLASRRTLVFLASNLAPLKANKVYQLWLMPANGSSPVPAGTFSPDAHGQASLVYTDFPSSVAAVGFSVTIENAGGAQTPTLPIILAGSSPA